MKVKRGFTLIELLVVIVIIGILASIVLASLNTARIKARDTRRIADIKQLELALQFYANACGGSYPMQLNFTTAYAFCPNVLLTNFIASIPKDPSGSDYFYSPRCKAPTKPNGFHLGAVLGTDHFVLHSDVDDPDAGKPCTGGAADFDGNTSGCDVNGGTDQCFDVVS
jgi:type II secretion system protein G